MNNQGCTNSRTNYHFTLNKIPIAIGTLAALQQFRQLFVFNAALIGFHLKLLLFFNCEMVLIIINPNC